jgi:hypothetical protein
MKRSFAPIVAIALLALGGAVILATSGEQGVPSAKSSVAYTGVAYDGSKTGGWMDVAPLTCVIKTSNVSDLIVSVNMECALVTDVKIKGTGQQESSTSLADIRVRVLVDNGDGVWTPVLPDNGDGITFASRKMTLTGLLWSGSQLLLELPEQFIQIWEKTGSAHSFDFLVPNVGVGVHNVKVQIMTDTQAGYEGADIGATIGDATLVVEAVRLVNN